MRLPSLGILVVFVQLMHQGCSDPNEDAGCPRRSFQSVFLESGRDSDHSYISLRTVPRSDCAMQLLVTRWGIVETGLFLDSQRNGTSLVLTTMGICGTVQTFTWEKVTFEYLLTRESERGFDRIVFTSGIDSLSVRRIR